jgi:predicted transcriptional regulator
MRFDELFENRGLFGEKLKECIAEKGYTKVSLAKKSDISRPTLDKILNGEIDSKSTFDKHIRKILSVIGMDADSIMLYNGIAPTIEAVYSNNEPMDYAMTDKAKKQYDLLQDVLDICSIYY